MRGRFLMGAASAALMLVCAAPAALAQSADQPGDRSTQARIEPGSAIQAEFNPGNDVDWFRLRVEPGQRYRITLDATPAEGESGVDPVLFVYDLGGNQLAYNDDSRGSLNSELFFTHNENVDVYLEARPFNPESTGSYRIAVEAAPLPADDVGNDASTRGRVTAGSPVTGALEYAGDVDWYRLNARRGVVYRIALNGGDGEGALRDPLVRVLSASGEELAYNDDGPNGLNSYLEFTPNASGPVFIEARGYADAYEGRYTLDVQSARQPRDAVAGDSGTRGRINIGQSVDGVLDFSGDRDWYRVRLAEGQTYRFGLESSGDSPVSDPLLRLYNARGDEVAMDDDGGGGLNSLIEFTASAAGTYYLEARGYSQDATGGYTLRALEGDIPASTSTDQTLSAEGDYREGALSPAGDRDWYRVDLSEGQALRISLWKTEGADALSDPYLVVYGPDGQEVARDDDSGGDLNAWLEYQAPATGAYYIEARGFSEEAEGRYAISIAPGEIGADMESAEHLTLNMGRVSTISTPEDVDWFALEMIEGRPYRIAVIGAEPDALADPYLTLYDANGQAVATDDDGGTGLNSYLSFTPVTGGVYFVGVSAYGAGGTGRYGVIAMDTEIPGHIYTDESLDAASGDDRSSRLDMPGDLDYFRVELEQGVSYQIDVTGAGRNPLSDPLVTLVDGENATIASDDDSGPGLNARLRFTPTTSGTYYVQVSGAGGVIGDYNVAIARR
ncbi:MAG: PPC domain-containing protein [Hyphomonadaceae bacterium]|nr:PPC domain-containing protein [Hyphomonadaceae bacterium]